MVWNTKTVLKLKTKKMLKMCKVKRRGEDERNNSFPQKIKKQKM